MATEGSPPPFCGPIWLRVNRIFPLAAAVPAWAVPAGIAIARAVIAATATAAAVFTRTSRLLDWVPDALLPGRSRTETAGRVSGSREGREKGRLVPRRSECRQFAF